MEDPAVYQAVGQTGGMPVGRETKSVSGRERA
jgi:hypothetical protein